MIAIDTNLLVYAHRSSTSEHLAARAAIERAANNSSGWGLPLPCISEFWSVVTHPASARSSTPEQASMFVDELIQSGGAAVLFPKSGFWPALSIAAKQLNLAGARIFDLQISMIARQNNASELWSHDRRFVCVPGIRVVDPLEE